MGSDEGTSVGQGIGDADTPGFRSGFDRFLGVEPGNGDGFIRGAGVTPDRFT